MHSRAPRSERGAAAIEFALVLIPLLLLLFGIIDFARALNEQQAVTASAREGVRILALNGTVGDAETRARDAASPIPSGELGFSPAPTTCDPTNPGTPARMTVTHSFTFVTPLPAFVPGLGSTLTLTGKGEMRCGG